MTAPESDSRVDHRDLETERSTVGMDPGESGLEQAALRVVFVPPGAPLPPALPLGDETFLIGRDVSATGLALHDARASRLHARVVWDPLGCGHRLGDAGSANGTFVNGRRVQTALLQPGDVLRFGSTLAVYELGDPIEEVREYAARAARSGASILIEGETGVGKELIARLIHERCGRPGEFVPVNCGAFPQHLIASELFGHARGAFSGADQARRGLFVAADRGTLFLDEIGELPLEQQPVLLRALQERAVRAVGSDRELGVDVRVVSATQVDLEHCAAEGRFRSDLYARLAQVTLHVPALRYRRADILPLLSEFIARGGSRAEIGIEAAEAMLLWRWPHNVRELQSLAAQFLALGLPGEPLDASFLKRHRPKLFSLPPSEPALRPSEIPDGRSERERLKQLLAEHDGNIAAVARALGKPRTHVYRWVRRFGLAPHEYRR